MSSLRCIISAVASLPKQLVGVYIGDNQSVDGCEYTTDLSPYYNSISHPPELISGIFAALPQSAEIIETCTLVIAILMAIALLVYVHKKHDGVKERVIYSCRKERCAQYSVAPQFTSV